MFPWPANRTLPKVKTTYTRKKTLYPTPPAAQNEDMPVADEAENTMVEEGGSMVEEGGSMLEEGESIAKEGESSVVDRESMVEEGESMAQNPKDPDTSMVGGNSVEAQVLQEVIDTTTKALSDEALATEASDNEDEVYVVEYFMAEAYKKVPGSNIPQKVLLTKWAGFDLAHDLTWEPESEMKKDVPATVKSYYARKVSGPSSSHSEASEKPAEVSQKPRGRPPKIAKTRGRPRKDNSTVLLGQHKVTKATRGRSRKDSKVPLGQPQKVDGARLGRPPKNSQARRGRPPKARLPETE